LAQTLETIRSERAEKVAGQRKCSKCGSLETFWSTPEEDAETGSDDDEEDPLAKPTDDDDAVSLLSNAIKSAKETDVK
jgi:hypothetical protein